MNGGLVRRWIVWVMLVYFAGGCGTRELAATSAAAGGGKATVDQICNIAAQQLGVDRSQVTAETSLGDLGADELDFVELVMEFEEHFGITIPDAAAEEMLGTSDWQEGMKNVTMAKLADLIEKQKGVVD